MRVLLTEDDKELAEITALNLKKHGLAVDVAFSGEQALHLFEDQREYDVVVLDLSLPDIDGLELLKDFKSAVPNLPVLALTARDGEEDRVGGIQKGLDDYLTKPFSCRELISRLRVLYRSLGHQPEEAIQAGKGLIQILLKSRKVLVNGTPIKLSFNELRLLAYLAERKGQLVLIKELLDSIWDMNGTNGSAKVVTTVSRLRAKIGDHRKRIIITGKGGYLIA